MSKRTPIRIHFVEKKVTDARLRPFEESEGLWVTGNWVIGEDTVRELVGKLVYVHKGQKLPAHAGGVIVDYEKLDSGRYQLIFRQDPKCIGFTEESRWGNEKKIVWQQ